MTITIFASPALSLGTSTIVALVDEYVSTDGFVVRLTGTIAW